MWVQKNKKGNYQFVERYKDPLSGKYKKVSVTYDANNRITRKRAQMVLEAHIQEKLRHVQDGNIKHGVTLQDTINEWEPLYKKRVRPRTWLLYKTVKKEIVEYVGVDNLVNQITPKYLIGVYEDMLYKHDYNNPIVKRVKSCMNMILRYAYKKDYVEQPPLAHLDVNWKKDKASSTEQKFLEADELKAVLQEARKINERFADIFEFQYLTGMRIGEVLGLQIKDIKLEGGNYYAQVNGTLNYFNLKVENYYKQSTPKTDSSFRDLLLPNRAVSIVTKWSEGKSSSEFLFARNGRFFDAGALNRTLRYVKAKLGIDKKLTTHTFRHTNISKLAELGVPLYIIQERVGHADSKVTSRIYLHVTNRAKKKYDNIIFSLK